MKTKQLSRLQPCVLFEIRKPQWNGGRKCVGLNTLRLGKHNEIRFSYVRKKDGELSLPDNYYCDGDEVKSKSYPTMNIGTTELLMIPVSELSILERI